MATVNEKMTAIADAIREKTGGTEPLGLDAMAQAIAALETGGGVELPDFITEIDFGTFVSTSYSAQQTIPHNLSDRPKGYYLWKAVDGVTGNYAVKFSCGYRGNIAYSSSKSYTAMVVAEDSGSVKALTTSGTNGGSYMDQSSFLVSAVLAPGDVYNWIAWR